MGMGLKKYLGLGTGLPKFVGSDALEKDGATNFTPLSFFANGENGAWYDPRTASSMFTDSGQASMARVHGNLKLCVDLAKSNPAVQSGQTSTIRWTYDRTTAKPYVRMNRSTDTLVINFGTTLGATCTIVYANWSGVEIREGVSVGSSFSINKSFFQFLIIDRALTSLEKAALRNSWRSICPVYYDDSDVSVWVSPSGNDANDGLTRATAKATLDAAHTVLRSLPSGAVMAALPGTYSAGLQLSTSALAKSQVIICPEDGVIVDLAETPGVGGGRSGLGADTPNYTLRWYGNGNTRFVNIGNNSIGSAAGTTWVYGILTDNSYDGTTAHLGTDLLAVVDCTFKNCLKGAIAHTAGTVNVYHENSIFYSKIGSVLGLGGIDQAVSGNPATQDLAWQCDFLPDPDITSVWTSFQYQISNTGAAGTGINRKHVGCRFGAPHRVVGTPATSLAYNASFENCYFNGIYIQPATGPALNDYYRCFGPKMTIRLRRGTNSVQTIRNCVFSGPALPSPNTIISADTYNGTTDVFGTGTVSDTILMGCATAIFAVSNTAVLNTNWQFLNNCFSGNTANYTSGVTADGTDLVANPLLSNPTTDEIEDWRVASNSPCIGAGVGGANIGLGVAA